MVSQIKTVIVIDCADAESFQINAIRVFPDTAEGNEAAKSWFIELVKSITDDKTTQEDVNYYLSLGIFHIGTGFIALIHSN